MNKLIFFALALNATPADVAEVQDAINRQFGTNSNGTIAPAAIASTATPPSGVVTNVTPPAASTPAVTHNFAELDKQGLPWDERIHSGSKAKIADGSWRGKKGVDPAFKTSIEAQLRATMAGSTAPVVAVTAPPAPPAAAAAPTIPAPPTTLPDLPPINPAYSAFVQFVTSQTKSADNPTGRITPEWVSAVLTQYGVADGSMQNLAHRADLIPTIEAAMRGALGL